MNLEPYVIGAIVGPAVLALIRTPVRVKEIGIRLAATHEEVSFEPTGSAANGKAYIGADELIKRTRHHLGGFRPYNSDAVYTLTSKDVGAGGAGEGVAGLADCIGGIRFADAAFAVGEAGLRDDAEWHVWGGKVAAHEIAHLLGAQHHYRELRRGRPGSGPRGSHSVHPDVQRRVVRLAAVRNARGVRDAGSRAGVRRRDPLRSTARHEAKHLDAKRGRSSLRDGRLRRGGRRMHAVGFGRVAPPRG